MGGTQRNRLTRFLLRWKLLVFDLRRDVACCGATSDRESQLIGLCVLLGNAFEYQECWEPAKKRREGLRGRYYLPNDWKTFDTT